MLGQPDPANTIEGQEQPRARARRARARTSDLAVAPIPSSPSPSPKARRRPVPSATSTPKPQRVRPLPSRDARGLFVAHPTTCAPNWYVFAADAYRIPGEPSSSALLPSAPAGPPSAPRAINRPRSRARFTRAHLENALLFLLFVVASALYWWHLPLPHH